MTGANMGEWFDGTSLDRAAIWLGRCCTVEGRGVGAAEQPVHAGRSRRGCEQADIFAALWPAPGR